MEAGIGSDALPWVVDGPENAFGGDGDLNAGAMRRLLQAELAQRWRISPRTLERWRRDCVGPAWLQLNGRVLYRLEDVLEFERLRLRRGVSTAARTTSL